MEWQDIACAKTEVSFAVPSSTWWNPTLNWCFLPSEMYDCARGVGGCCGVTFGRVCQTAPGLILSSSSLLQKGETVKRIREEVELFSAFQQQQRRRRRWLTAHPAAWTWFRGSPLLFKQCVFKVPAAASTHQAAEMKLPFLSGRREVDSALFLFFLWLALTTGPLCLPREEKHRWLSGGL